MKQSLKTDNMKNVLVVMPYDEEWSDKIWEYLEKLSTKNKELNIDRIDTRVVDAEKLDEHIEKHNRESDIIIADITGNNPNVLIEVGLSLALKKPLFIITQKKNEIPAHLKGRIYEVYNPDDDESLTRLISILNQRIKERIKVINTDIQTFSSDLIYQVECFSRRELVELEKYFNKATHRIDILTTNLTYLLETCPNSKLSYFDHICTSLNRKGSKTKVRVLTLNPESDFAAKRGIQLGYAPAVFRDDLRKSLKQVEKISEKYPIDRFEVRSYEDFPNQITFRIDGDVFNCVVAQPTQSRNHITFKLDRKRAGVENSFITHFLNIWKDVKKV